MSKKAWQQLASFFFYFKNWFYSTELGSNLDKKSNRQFSIIRFWEKYENLQCWVQIYYITTPTPVLFNLMSLWRIRIFFDKFLWNICMIPIISFNIAGTQAGDLASTCPAISSWSRGRSIPTPRNSSCQMLIWRRTIRTSRTTPRSPSGSTTPRTAATGRVSSRLETSCSRTPLPNASWQLVIILLSAMWLCKTHSSSGHEKFKMQAKFIGRVNPPK